MREGTEKHWALLGVELYEISNNFIYELREKQKNCERVFELLPEYTINNNSSANNRPALARYHHQFAGSFKHNAEANEKYPYFNLRTLDSFLEEEISNAGIEDLFKKFDFKKILFTSQSENDTTKFVFPYCNYLVVEIIYITSYDHYSGGYECDTEIDIIGYLNNNLQTILFENSTNN